LYLEPPLTRGRRNRKEELAGKMDGRKGTGMVEGKVSPMLAHPS
jgi:hypothetical protein